MIINQTSNYKPASFMFYFEQNLTSKIQLNKQQSLQQVLQQIQIDLSKLLNHKRSHIIAQYNHIHVQDSILAYGLPDLSHYNPNSERDRSALKQLLQQTIENFEPRLNNISVIDKQNEYENLTTSMFFTVHATLNLAEQWVDLSFDSIIQPDCDAVQIKNFQQNNY